MSTGALAFVFPGQGSQFVGMGKAAYDRAPEARAVFDEVDEALGFALSKLCFGGDEAELRRTENTQPAILTVSVALLRVLERHGLVATHVAGHSLGEYTALVAVGSIELVAAVRLVRNRGRYMQEAVAEGVGAMAAILGLDDDRVDSVCAVVASKTGKVVAPANFNSPGQVVIAGHAEAVAAAVDLARAEGAKRARLLNVSAPFHCALMAPAADRLRHDLAAVSFADPRLPVTCNVDAAAVRDGSLIADALYRQVTAPVRWTASVQAMAAAGVGQWVEVGPGKVLAGLIKRTVESRRLHSFAEPTDIDALAGLCGSGLPQST